MNIAKKLLLANLVNVVIVLSACGQKVPVSPISTLPIKTATIPSTATSLPIPTATVERLPKSNIVEKCPDALPSAELSKIEAKGVVVLLKSQYLDDVREAYLLNLANNQAIEFSQEGESLSYYAIAISPDRKTLAYRIITPKDKTIKLVLSNSLGERPKIIPLKSDIPYPMYGTLGGWINNQQLLLDGEILNPYTGEKQSFNPKDFPDTLPDDFGVVSLQFDPELTRIIYPHSHATTALANLQTKQILAQLPAHTRGAPEIAWSPDGGFVAIIGRQTQESTGDEIFLIDRDGKVIRQLTHLSTNYDGKGYGLSKLSWSPDGNRISFWQNAGKPNAVGLRLFVLDTKTEELTSYCIWGETIGTTLYGPIWSPDSKQLLIGDFNVKGKVRATIVDLDSDLSVPIGEDMMPIGWISPP